MCRNVTMSAEEGWAFRQKLQHQMRRPEGDREHILFVRSLGRDTQKPQSEKKNVLWL